VVLVVALACATIGCTDPAVQGPTPIEDAVRAYNQQLVVAFAEQDMNALAGVATEEQATREFYLMAALGEGGVRMVSTLGDIEFGDVTYPAEGQATVATRETWDYDHVSLETGDTVRSERGIVYELRYTLVLEDGLWLVAAVDPVAP
jgi:hypothetical protein